MKTTLCLLILGLWSTFTMGQSITQLEYFYNTDPGFGNAISITANSNTGTVSQQLSIPLDPTFEGFNAIGIRAQDDTNTWSLYETKVFYVIPETETGATAITTAEYFINSDPGFGNGTSISVDSNSGTVNQTLSLSIDPNLEGFNKLTIRVQDDLGIWSLYASTLFYVYEVEESSPIVAAEYYYDTDPGFGNGTSAPVIPTGNPDEFMVDLSTVEVNCGLHDFYLRLQNDRGEWSLYDIGEDVDIYDDAPPTIVSEDITVELDENGQTTITVEDIDNGTFDDCELASVAIDLNSFTCAELGENSVTITATDALGNETSGTAIVTVEDLLPPTVITQNISITLDENGEATVSEDDIDNGSTDNCTISLISLDKDTFTCYDTGENIVTLTVTDQSGNEASETAIVTVEAALATFNGSWDNIPNEGSKAVFETNYNTETFGSVTACSCEIATNATVTINAGNFLLSERDIVVNGTLFVDHEGSVVQIDNEASVIKNGNITVRKTTPDLAPMAFMIQSSPMTTETRSGVYGNSIMVRNHITGNFSPNEDVTDEFPLANNFADNNGDNWVNYNGTINPGEGYLVRPQPTQTASGQFDLDYTLGTLNNGEITFDLLFNSEVNDSPNILGNPYPSAIDADLFMIENPTVQTMYFWEHLTDANSDYPGYNQNNYDMGDISLYSSGMGGLPAANGGTTPNQFIASGQGFAVKTPVMTSVMFNNAMRVVDNNNTYRRNSADRDRIWLRVESQLYQLGSTTLVGFSSAASDDFDSYYDVPRMATAVSLFTKLPSGEELGIQGRSSFYIDVEVPLSFSSQVDRQTPYTISISEIDANTIPVDISIFLKDNNLGSITNLLETNYTFEADSGTQIDRFTLLFRNPSLGTPDFDISDVRMIPNPTSSVVTINVASEVIKKIDIYDIRGRLLETHKVNEQPEYEIDFSLYENAVYLVTIKTATKTITSRIVKE